MEALSVAIRAATARNGVGLFTNLLRRLYAFPACFLGETFDLDSFGIGMPSMITALINTFSSAS